MSNGDKKEPPKAVAIYGTAQQIEQYGERLKHVLPGGDKLSPLDAVVAGDYAKAIDANIFRGEIYAYNSKGKLVLVESYKLLVRWARRQSDFFDKEEELAPEEMESLDLDPAEDIAWRIWILREDKLDCLTKLAKVCPFDEAYKIVAQSAIGVVTKRDRTTRDGKDQDPPVGWTWHDVAKKRALKNALNKAYGVPSPREIAEESWRVGDVETKPEDWREAMESAQLTDEERARLAAMAALERERAAAFDALTPEEQAAKVEDNREVLGQPPEDFDGFDTPEPPPEPDEEQAEPPPAEAVEVPRGGNTPEVIRRTCRYHAGWKKDKDPDWADAYRPDPPPSDPVNETVLSGVSAALNNAIGKGTTKQKDDKRHAVYRYLFGVNSGAALTMKEAQAILMWIGLPHAQKVGEIKAMAPTEVQAVVKAAELAAGQQEMDLGV